MNSVYTVSVRLQSFNHAAYIREAVESVLAQKTSFRVELVCGDDFSTDDTLQILKSYKDTENVSIKVLERKIGDVYWRKRQRLGRLYNFTDIIENCTGKYIALLDGDDYWLDQYKLQKQVDFLESNLDCIACHHWHKYAVRDEQNGRFVVVEAPKRGQGYYPERKATVGKIFANLMRVKSRTLMFRNVLDTFPAWFYDVAYGDVALSMILGKYGDFGFIDEPMAVYRQTNQGVSSDGKQDLLFFYNHYIEWIRVWEYGNRHYKGMYLREALGTIRYFYRVILHRYNYSVRIFRMVGRYALLYSQFSFLPRLRITLGLLKTTLRHRVRRSKLT